MFFLRSKKIWDKSRMRLSQLYKILQDVNTTDELMLFTRAISSISCFLVKCPLHDGCYIFFADYNQGPFRTWPLKNYLYPVLKQLYSCTMNSKVLLHMIVLSPHSVCLDPLQSKLAYTFENYLGQMYPVELEIKDTTESNTSAFYLVLLLSIGRDGQFHTSIYDKRDDFNFHITNFPFLSSNITTSPTNGVFIS